MSAHFGSIPGAVEFPPARHVDIVGGYVCDWRASKETLMPSIMDRLDSAFLTKELNAKLFHNTILEQQLLIALSPPVAFTEINYERLEFLGK